MLLILLEFGILGRVWYLIVSIPDLCTLTYFEEKSLKDIESLTLLFHIQFHSVV